MTTRDDIINEALTWKSTPYQHRGRVKGVGVDCGALIYEVYGRFIGPLPEFPQYPPDWTLHRGDEIYQQFVERFMVRVAEPIKAGLTLWQIGRCYGHGTLYLGEGRFLHSWGRNGCGSVQVSQAKFFGKKPCIHYDLNEQCRHELQLL